MNTGKHRQAAMLPTNAQAVDVLVYGGTAAGVMAAVAAARRGASVRLLEPGRHIGGMLSGGLSYTDFQGMEAAIGGLAADVFSRIGRAYGEGKCYHFEPHVADNVLHELLTEAGIAVEWNCLIDQVEMTEGRITCLTTTNGNCYPAHVFIDAGYEGDLLARAGVPFVVGREGRDVYAESLAGRTEILPGHHQFVVPVSGYEGDALLPYITPAEDLAPTGTGDGRFQSYCYRLCLTDQPANRIPIECPEHYNPHDYELLRRYFSATGNRAASVLGIGRIANGKADINSNGPISTNLPGGACRYPNADEPERETIRARHLQWAHGLLWFLQQDPSVPPAQRKAVQTWGLCRDEFKDTGGWPHQLYVREGRRMIGDYVVTQQDLMHTPRKPDVIGMGGYNIDIREVQWVSLPVFDYGMRDEVRRHPRSGERVFMEGYVTYPVHPWDIPYRCLVPQRNACTNLIVPVCASMSTIAFASFRMEPAYMIAGHAAGTAASLALDPSTPVQDVDISRLQQQLRDEQQILTL